MEDAEQLKLHGNQCFKEKRFYKACAHYEASLKLKKDATVFANRAQAYINLKLWINALVDCNNALSVNPKSDKALYRRACVLDALGLRKQALKDAQKCTSNSSDAHLTSFVERLRKNQNDIEMLTVECVERDDFARCETDLIDIEIQCDDFVENSSMSPVSVVDIPPVKKADGALPPPAASFQDFTRHFLQLKPSPESFTKYVLALPEDSIPRLLDDMIDVEHVSYFLVGAQILLQLGEVSAQILLKRLMLISTVKRFEMIPLFMTVADMKGLKLLISEANSAEGDIVAKLFNL